MVHPNRLSRRTMLSLMVSASLPSAEELSGGWSATFGERTIAGTWTGQQYEEKDAAWGTWSLLDRASRPIVSGTWAARKVKGKWEGRWQAEAEGRGAYSGSWRAEARAQGSLPMYELLREALEGVVWGTWSASNQLSGTWAIQATAGTKPSGKEKEPGRGSSKQETRHPSSKSHK